MSLSLIGGLRRVVLFLLIANGFLSAFEMAVALGGQGVNLNEELWRKRQGLEDLNREWDLESGGGNSRKYSKGSFQCPDKYTHVLNQGKLDMTVVFGYNDNEEGLVSDAYEKSALIEALTQPCHSQYLYACGFALRDDQTLTKMGQWQGQDIQITMHVQNSSFSLIDRDNKSDFKDQQREKSLATEQVFIKGLQLSDAVFYVGHSRDGGGPDFQPPRLLTQGKVNYPWYRQNEPGLKVLLKALKTSIVPAPLVGLFSCASRQHFKGRIHAEVPRARLMLSENLSHFVYFNQVLLGALDAVIGFKCAGAFQESLSVPGLKRRLVGLHYF